MANITAPPNNHPTCQEARALAELIASAIEAEGYECSITIDPYTLYRQCSVSITSVVKIPNYGKS